MAKYTHNALIFVFASIVGFFCLHLGLRLTAYTTTSGLPVPVLSRQYTVQQLLNLINKNNSAQTSNFILPVDSKGNAIVDASCWQVKTMNVFKGGGYIRVQVIENLAGSRSASGLGLAGIINDNLRTLVTLQEDPDLINSLYNTNCLNSTTKSKYAKILLYFVLNGYRFYINDPFPGKVVVGRVNPAASIISKWNLNATYNP